MARDVALGGAGAQRIAARSTGLGALASLSARCVAWVVGSLLRVRRAHVLASLERAGVGASDRIADAMYLELAVGVIELLTGAPLGAAGAALDSPAVRALLRLERGFVVATAHTAGWDTLACEAAAVVPLTVISKRLSVGWLDSLWQRLRGGRRVQIAHAGAAASAARAALAQGGAVAMLIDQAPDRQRGTLVVDFLGAPARVDLAPALIAARARVPVAVVFGRRGEDGRVRAELRALHEPPPRPGRRWAEEVMRAATAELERFVRERPEQWLWMHRRWKDCEDAPR